MKVCVLGLGYIGLPTALMFAKSGAMVRGVDINKELVNKINKKEILIQEDGLLELLIEAVDQKQFKASTVPTKADAFIIAVPTPINKNKTANLTYVLNAIKMIIPFLEKENLIIIESTITPNCIKEEVLPFLKENGIEKGDIFIAHSPERVLPGKLIEELINNDRVIGGFNQESIDRAVELYKMFVKGKIYTTSTTIAEMVKLMENTYRDVNIALANEFAIIGERLGINIWEAIKLANCHPRVNIHNPGPGVGGHCIAIDPWFIIEKFPEESKLISLAREINDKTPLRIGQLIEKVMKSKNGKTVSIFGLAYKGNSEDIRESPSLSIINYLQHKGFTLRIFDPVVEKSTKNLGLVNSFEEAITEADCVVILTDHHIFKELNFLEGKKLLRNHIIIDTRNLLDKDFLVKNGFEVIVVGN